MASLPRTTVACARVDGDELAIELTDLAATSDHGDGVLGSVTIDVGASRAGTVVRVDVDPEADDLAVLRRLLLESADRLRAIGRQRLTVPMPVSASGHLALLSALGFELVRTEDELAWLALAL